MRKRVVFFVAFGVILVVGFGVGAWWIFERNNDGGGEIVDDGGDGSSSPGREVTIGDDGASVPVSDDDGIDRDSLPPATLLEPQVEGA